MQHEKPPGRTSPVIVVLLAAILLALIVLIAMLARTPDHVASAPSAQSGTALPKPSAPVDTSRIEQTYQVGRRYRSLLKFALDARASHQDWGIASDTNLHYVGEVEIVRTIESNDGRTLELTQEFRRAGAISCWTKLEGLRFELGMPAHVLLEIGGLLAGAPLGWSLVTVDQLNQIVGNEFVLGLLRQAAQDPDTRIRRYVESLSGKTVHITYRNGEGVTNVRPIGCKLDDAERSMIEATCVTADAYILPNPNCKEGDTWTIHGQDLPALLDPSLRAALSGTLTARRGADSGPPESRTAQIKLAGGVLDLYDANQSTETLARWAPTGEMTYSFRNRIVTAAELSGDFRIEQRSRDHLIFQARFSSRPTYKITYFCEVLP